MHHEDDYFEPPAAGPGEAQKNGGAAAAEGLVDLSERGLVHGMVQVCVVKGRSLRKKDGTTKPSPYVVACLGTTELRSDVQSETIQPVWDKHMTFEWRPNERPFFLVLEVWDRDPFNADELMGVIMVPLASNLAYRKTAWFTLGRARREPVSGSILLDLCVKNPSAVAPSVYRQFFSFVERRRLNMSLLTDEARGDGAGPAGGAGGGADQAQAVPVTTAERAAFDDSAEVDETEDGVMVRAPPQDPATPQPPAPASVVAPVAQGTPTSGGHLPPEPSAGCSTPLGSPTKRRGSACSTSSPTRDWPQTKFFQSAGHRDIDPRFSVPNHTEQIEVHATNVIIGVGTRRTVGDVYLTDFRLVFDCEPPDARSTDVSNGSFRSFDGDVFGGSPEELSSIRMRSNIDLSASVSLGVMREVRLLDDLRGHVAHRVETGDNGAKAAGRGRTGPKKGAIMLVIDCLDCRTITLTFTAPGAKGNQLVAATARALAQRIEFVMSNSADQPIALVFGPVGKSADWKRYDVDREMERQGVLDEGARDCDLSQWQRCVLNESYALCPTYPRTLYLPRCLNDETIIGSAQFRSKGRLPVLCWYSKRRGTALVRCAQPMVGATGRRSAADETLVTAFRLASSDPSLLIIFDARSSLAAGGNKLMGKGSELTRCYANTKLYFMEIANIHSVRESYDSLQALVQTGSEDKWLTKLDNTGWLKHIRAVLSAACVITRKIQQRRVTCMIHCSDGWDRTSQLTSLAQIFLDPYYRTIDGFIVVVEKEWLSFGHKFRDRKYSPDKPHERSPVFLQFLDCVWQATQQFPHEFEFNSRFLVEIAKHSLSDWFGTFLFNCDQMRRRCRLDKTTTSLWSHIDAIRETLLNEDYRQEAEVIIPISSMKRLSLWTDFYLRFDETVTANDDEIELEEEAPEHNVVVWVPDQHATVCQDCHLRFTLFRRRHHCRACGQVFCGDCTKHRMALPAFGYRGEERACEACYNAGQASQTPQYPDFAE